MMCGWHLGGRVCMSLPIAGRWPNQKLKGGFGWDVSVEYC